ncbi:hypothetical protein MMC28_011063 [Mycoblastus sanguinarius]|nr:hypothetical protein [Mycoblastus sanguinarius]
MPSPNSTLVAQLTEGRDATLSTSSNDSESHCPVSQFEVEYLGRRDSESSGGQSAVGGGDTKALEPRTPAIPQWIMEVALNAKNDRRQQPWKVDTKGPGVDSSKDVEHLVTKPQGIPPPPPRCAHCGDRPGGCEYCIGSGTFCA